MDTEDGILHAESSTDRGGQVVKTRLAGALNTMTIRIRCNRSKETRESGLTKIRDGEGACSSQPLLLTVALGLPIICMGVGVCERKRHPDSVWGMEIRHRA